MREDFYTNTEHDAAQFERGRSREYPPDAPDLADVLDLGECGCRPDGTLGPYCDVQDRRHWDFRIWRARRGQASGDGQQGTSDA
jgi:hypothetical protein